jgi:putative glutamine amidotransferase
MAGRSRPVVGITTDVVEGSGGRLRADCGLAYAQRVAAAGGLPVLLAAAPELVGEHIALCEGFVFTGGDDPRMESFGEATHPEAKPVHPLRQEYETALLRALGEARPQTPVLGVCLGMQMMALVAGGRLNQHLPETLATAGAHRGIHRIEPAAGAWPRRLGVEAGEALSHHHQAVSDPGGLVVVARAEDGVIEGVADPGRAFYVGVQWHPERTEGAALGQGLFERLLSAIRGGPQRS